MATITKVCRKNGDAYKAVIRLRGSKIFSKTFKLRKHAKAWADHMERDIEASRAYGNAHARTMNLSELIRLYIHSKPDASSINIAPEERWKMIAIAAYHKAEKRGVAPGDELQDWADAEKEIDELIYG